LCCEVVDLKTKQTKNYIETIFIKIQNFCQVARKLAMVEADLERAEERAEAGEA
jgi:hypothetical protein